MKKQGFLSQKGLYSQITVGVAMTEVTTHLLAI
jgi:hypothetical protein